MSTRKRCLVTGLDGEPIMENDYSSRYQILESYTVERQTPLHSAARSGSKLQVRVGLLELPKKWETWSRMADASLKTVSRIIEPKLTLVTHSSRVDGVISKLRTEVTSFLWPMTEFKRVLFEPLHRML